MEIPEQPTYILKYTTHTITAIASIQRATPNPQRNVQYDVHITTAEDSSVQKTAKGWRTTNEEHGDLFIVEVEPGVPSSRFELPFAHAVIFADEAQEKLSQRR